MLLSSRTLKIAASVLALTVFSLAGLSFKWTNVNSIFASAESRPSEVPFIATPMTIGTCDTAGPIEVEATAGTTAPTAYATLKLAFDAINAGTHQGTINIEICGSTTEGTTPATLNSSGAGTASYTSVNIHPLADNLTISGNPVTGFGVIQLNGADNVTIDGDNPNTTGTNRDLTISNTATNTVIANSAIRIATSAAVTSSDNDTIKNLNLLGNVTGGNASSITSTSGSSNSSFGIYVGGNGGATATGAPTAITSVTSNTAPSGTTVNNLLIDNNVVNQCARAIVFNGAAAGVSTGVTISNNVIGDQGAIAPATPPFTSPATTVYTKGIWVSGSSSVTVTGNSLKNILSYVGTTMTAIEVNSAVTSSTIANNSVTNLDNSGTVSIAKGILVSSNTAAYSIAGNSVSNVQTLANQVGTDAIEVTASATGGTIERNQIKTVYNRSTAGVYGLNVTSGTGIVIKNNFVSDVLMDMTAGAAFSTTQGVHGIRVAGGTGHKVYYNTVNLFGTLFGTAASNILTSAFTPTAATITGMDIRNNIFSNTITGGTTSVAHVSIFLPSSATSAMNLTINNNDYFAGPAAGSTGIAHVGTTYTANPAGTPTFVGLYTAANFNASDSSNSTNLRTYTSTLNAGGTNDNASIVSDPALVSNSDLHLTTGSPDRDVAAVIASVTDDVDGQVRPGVNSLFDIGADEFDGLPPNDIEATAFVDPLNGRIKAAGSSFAPQASFTNDGAFTQTSVKVRYRICSDSACMSPVYNQTAIIGSIARDATAIVTFPNASIATPGNYTIKATAELPTDTVHANDEISGSLNIIAPLSGTYAVGSGGDFASLTNPGGLFDVINSVGATSNVAINITSDLTGETGAVALNEIPGGFSIAIKPTGAARTIIGSSTNSIIRLNGADKVTIDGSLTAGTPAGVGGTASLRNLTIQNTNASATAGAVIAVNQGPNSANNITIKNVIISGQAPTQTFIGIHVGGNVIGTAPTGVSNNSVVIDNCSFKRSLMAIFDDGVSAAVPATGNVITHNDMTATGIDRLRRSGIVFFNQNGILVESNAIGGIADDENADAIGIAAGIQDITGTAATSGGVFNSIIDKNRITGITSTNATGFSAAGIAIAGDPAGGNTVANNMISGVSAPSTSPNISSGIFVSGVAASSTHLFYNSVAMTGERGSVAGQTGSYGIAISGANPTVELKNNIFYNTQTSSGAAHAKSYAIGIGTSAFTNLSSDHNDFFSSGANAGGFRIASLDTAGTDLGDLSSWQAATNADSNSLTLDPSFINPAADVHITGTSPVRTIGTAIASISDDIDGQTRSAQPDLGADEVRPGVVQFSSSSYTIGENGGTASLIVTRTGGTDGPVSVNYATAGGSATGGAACGGSVDYVTTIGTVNFPSGDSTNKTIGVPICNDSVFEGSESFNATLSNASGGAALGTTTSATATITDDETTPSIQFSSDTYSTVEGLRSLSPEGVPGTQITITLSGRSQFNATVQYATTGGTARGDTSCSAGVDYVSTSGTATVSAGQTSTSFFVPICPDTVFEGDETVNLLMSSPSGALLGMPSSAVLTIVDNDTAAPVEVTATAGTTGPTGYSTVKAAVDAINAGTHQGNITVEIGSNIVEASAPIVLNGSGAGPATYTSILIRPTADNITISGATPTGRGLIELNGASNVTIDGDNPGTAGVHRDLTLQNSAFNTTTFTSVVRLALAASVITSTDNVVVTNLTIVGSATGRNIASANSSNGAENTTFGIFAGPGASTTTNTTAPSPLSNVSSSIGAGATATDLNISNNNITSVARAISVNGSATSVFPNLKIMNNQIGNPTAGSADQVSSIGISAQGSPNGLISGNTIWVEGFVAATTATHGIEVGVNSATGTFTIDSNKVSRVQNNNGQTWSAYGIDLGGGNNDVVQNNFVSGVINSQTAGNGAFGTTFGAYGIRVANGTGHKIYNNSVHLYGQIPGTTSTNLTASFLITSTALAGIDVRNNVFSNQIAGGNPTGTRNVEMYLPSAGSSAMNLTLNNNGYFSGPDNLNRLAQVGSTLGTGEYFASDFDPTAAAPAANLRSYTSTLSTAATNDNASTALYSPPPFVSNTDLHITSGTHTRLESGGTSVGLNFDVDGDTRNSTTPDIGADEFSGSPPFANDISALGFVTPVNGAVLTVGQSFMPQATFVNNGTSAQSAITVRYRILNSSMSEIYNQTVAIPTLAPLQTFTATFPSTSLPSSGAFSIIAKSELAGDQDTSNDTLTGSVSGVAPITGLVNVGAGQTYTSLTNAGGIFDTLNSSGISGNVTINITSDLTSETGAVALNQLVELGAGGYTVTIKPSGAPRVISGTSAPGSGLIILNGADRVIIDGSTSGGTDRSLTITNNQATTGVVIWMHSASASNGATNNTVKNCILNGAPGPNSTTVAGILTGSGAILGNDAEASNSNNTVQNNWIYRVQSSLYLRGGTSAPTFDQNWTIIGNELGTSVANDKNIFRGMLIGNAKTFTIANNLVHGIQSSTTTSAAMSGIQLAFLVDTGTISGNKISDIKNVSSNGTGAYGMQISSTSSSSNVTIANNFISDVTTLGSSTVNSNGFGLMFSGSGGGYDINFNSVNINTDQPSAQTTAAVNVASSFATPTALSFRNNIFANTQTTGARYGVYSTAAANVFTTIDYNDYFAPNIGFIGGATAATLSDWQTATGQDTHSKSVDPLFVSSSDLHLQPASTMRSMGLNGTGITTDIDGNARDSAPDIGAHELPFLAAPGTLKFSAATYSISENGGTATITVTRSGGSDGAVGVNFATSNGTATGGGACGGSVDYVTSSGTLTWADGDSGSKTFTIPICNDLVPEADETVNIALSGATGGATIGTPGSSVLTITNDDVDGTISVNDVRVWEGNSGTTNATFTVTYIGSAIPVSVRYSTSNGSAIAGVDYVSASGTLNFNAPGPLAELGGSVGQTQTVTVQVIGDTVKEENETFFLNLTNPTNVVISDGQGVGIINDDDRTFVSDFDHDLTTDLSVFRPSEGRWYVLQTTNATPKVVSFGASTDRPVPGDYDGDGFVDYAVWTESTGNWNIKLSSNDSVVSVNWGLAGDKPVQGDYDGDGKTDIAIYRPSTGTWWLILSSNGSRPAYQFGISTDLPVQADYDGDNRTDIAVYRNGTWYIARSRDGQVQVLNFGISTDKPVTGDFDGDGSYDVAVYRDGDWWIANSLTGTVRSLHWGISTDIPVPADYDKDGITDIAVFRPSEGDWYILESTTNSLLEVHWGAGGDIPTPASYLPQ